MSRLFVIADLHFGHDLVAKARGFATPADHDAYLVERWNATVTKRDVVYVLGDVMSLRPVPLLRGTKKLLMGNHDTYPAARYLGPGLFSRVAAYHEHRGCLMSHIPVHRSQSRRYRRNIHGHSHAAWVVDQDGLRDPWYVCVSAEQTGLVPALLSLFTD